MCISVCPWVASCDKEDTGRGHPLFVHQRQEYLCTVYTNCEIYTLPRGHCSVRTVHVAAPIPPHIPASASGRPRDLHITGNQGNQEMMGGGCEGRAAVGMPTIAEVGLSVQFGVLHGIRGCRCVPSSGKVEGASR